MKLKFTIMAVITDESETFKEIVHEIRSLKDEISKIKHGNSADKWLSSLEVQKILGISQKTWQSYRDKRLIPFSQIGQKIYVKTSDLESFLISHNIGKRR